MSEDSAISNKDTNISEADKATPIVSSSQANHGTNEQIFMQKEHSKGCGCGAGGMETSPSDPENPARIMNPSTYSYILALGTIQPRFPRPSIEKEYFQMLGRAGDTAGQTDLQAMQSTLAKRENRYLVRQLCWVLTIEGLETFILQPRDPADFDLLVDALRPSPRPTDVDIVIGVRGPIATPETCNGLMVPIVFVDQIYSFDVDALIKSIPRPERVRESQFKSTAEELFFRIMQLADNAGATDEHRALNYLAVRYSAIYAHTTEMHGKNFSLSAVEVRTSPLSGTRKIVDVIFSYTNRNTDVVEKYFVRVDVTEEFPFLVTKLSPYYDRQ
jgi:cyclic patellamide precursor peptide PatG